MSEKAPKCRHDISIFDPCEECDLDEFEIYDEDEEEDEDFYDW